jgi:hypothetical protein
MENEAEVTSNCYFVIPKKIYDGLVSDVTTVFKKIRCNRKKTKPKKYQNKNKKEDIGFLVEFRSTFQNETGMYSDI